MPGIERIDSLFSIPNISQEFEVVKSGLVDSQKLLVDLFNITKQYKDTTLTNLASNTERLTTAITGSVEATQRAKTNFDNLTNSISAQVRAANDNAAAIVQSSAGWDKLIQQSIKNKIALDGLTSSQSALKKSFQEGTISMGEYESSLTSIKDAQVNLKTSNADITKTINNMSKEAQASTGSLDQMRATLSNLTREYDKLGAAERDSAGGQSLQKTIQSTNTAITELEVSTGRSQRKVGDYTGALRILESTLAAVKANMTTLANAGQQNTAAYQKMSEEAGLLNVLVGQQEKGFSSVTMQIRATERALQTLRAEGFGATEAFDQLRTATASAAQQQKEFQRQQKLLESEAPVLGAVTLAAKGLAGAYAIGAGSVALFADGNEKVEKELNKLIAIMTILQGLHEAYELINQAGAIAAAIRIGLNKAANAVFGTNIGLTQAAIAAKTELTTAEAALAAAQVEGAVATEAEVAALQAQVVAATEAAVATEAAAAASVEAASAFAATGIGIVIAAVAVAVIYLIAKIKDWTADTKLNEKQQKELTEALDKQLDTLKEINELYDKRPDRKKDLADLEKQLSLEEKSGQNQYKILATKQLIADKIKENANAEAVNPISQAEDEYNGSDLKGLAALKQAEKDYFQSYTDAAYRASTAAKNLAAAKAKPDATRSKTDITELQDISDRAEADKKYQKDKFEYYFDAENKINEAEKGSQETRTELIKLSEDDRRKVILESIKIETDLAKSKNALILSDDKSTLSQRLEAMKGNLSAERMVIEAQRANVENTKSSTPADILIANKTAAADQLKATMDAADAESKLKRAYYIKDRDAAMEAAADLLNDDIKNNDAILAQDKTRFAQRSALEEKNYQDRRAIIGAQLMKDIDQEGLTNEQRLAVIQKYNSAIHDENLKQAKIRQDEQKREQERQLKDAQDFLDKKKDAIDIKEGESIIDLNANSKPGAFTTAAYDGKKDEIENKAIKERMQNQVTADEVALNSFKEGTKERADAQAKLTQDAAKLSQKELDDRKKVLTEKQQAELKVVDATVDLVKSAIDDRYENELNHIQKLTEANDRARAREIEGINSSTLSQQEKANAIIIANARVDAQNKLLADKAKKVKHDEAVSDKAFAIAKATEDGILAYLAALKAGPVIGPILAAVAAGLAAIQIAELVATPIPAYKGGVTDHPGGPAILHRDELIIEPGKSPYISPGDDVLMDLSKHTRVIPADKIRQMDEAGMFINKQGILVSAKDDGKKIDQLNQTMIWHAQRIEAALAKQKKVTIVHNHISNEFLEYITKAVYK